MLRKSDNGDMPDVYEMLPECFRTPETLESLDLVIDVAAANSRWSNRDVARAVCRLFHLISASKGPYL